MRISILTDNRNSWFVPYGEKLSSLLLRDGHDVYLCYSSESVRRGDVCFLLSCTKKLKKEVLAKNKNNIVIHASDLPKGRGFSPIQHQIREGCDCIVLTVFEATEEIDAGPYYLKKDIALCGNELLVEIRDIIGRQIISLCDLYIRKVDAWKPIQQSGVPTFYNRLTKADDEIDIDKTIFELMNQFRASDFKRFPPFFVYQGRKFFLEIKPSDE